MIWPNDIAFEGFQKKIDNWYVDKDYEMCDPPIDAQFALDLILRKYSRKYRKFKRIKRREKINDKL